jgi:hypothetical protein
MITDGEAWSKGALAAFLVPPCTREMHENKATTRRAAIPFKERFLFVGFMKVS